MTSGTRITILDAPAVDAALHRMAGRIRDFAGATDNLVLVGIQRRGVELADRLSQIIGAGAGRPIPRGALDITLYRDDLETVGPRPLVGETRIPCDLTGRCVVIVDDVLYTGRTVRAALDELADFGRPSRIGLSVLIDRGGRELPIQADVVGHEVQARPGDLVEVRVRELDGRDAVELVQGMPG